MNKITLFNLNLQSAWHLWNTIQFESFSSFHQLYKPLQMTNQFLNSTTFVINIMNFRYQYSIFFNKD